uniref:Odorant receptor n=1 Tax=Streltzoviella insularis TaxID=1206366 RepID=A0A7D5UMU6_9NEOP|nr:odorant receptor 55 [Streltzoviella insularis]
MAVSALVDSNEREKIFLSFNLKCLFYAGLWPNSNWSKIKKALYKIYEGLLHILSFKLIIITAIGSYQHRNDIIVVLSSCDKYLVAYNYVLKTIFFIINREKLKILITEISYSDDKIDEKRIKQMIIYVVIMATLTTTLSGIFSCFSLYNGEMTIEAWMPFDPMKSTLNLFLATQILIIDFLVPCLYRGIAMQGIVCSIIMYICDQLVELQDRIKKIKYSPEYESAMRAEFKEILKKHVRMIRYSNLMTNIFKEYFLIQNLAVTMELCVNALMISSVDLKEITLLSSFVAFLFIALINAYIYSYLGTELIIQSHGIALAAYESTWTSWPVDLQKDLLIVITVAQKPLELNAAGITTMSLQTYSQVKSYLDCS